MQLSEKLQTLRGHIEPNFHNKVTRKDYEERSRSSYLMATITKCRNKMELSCPARERTNTPTLGHTVRVKLRFHDAHPAPSHPANSTHLERGLAGRQAAGRGEHCGVRPPNKSTLRHRGYLAPIGVSNKHGKSSASSQLGRTA